jgi:glycosyltransferase involved in cell wall biosynthesis
MRSLFVYNPADLKALVPGGVQRCTREFLSVVEAASDYFATLEVDYDSSVITKLKRRTRLFPYAQYDAPAWRKQLINAIEHNRIEVVFLNRAELARFVSVISEIAPSTRSVLMSHGNESGDLVHEVGVHRKADHRNVALRWYDYLWLGGDLAFEAQIRHENDFTVIAMSEAEAVIERWLGAADVVILPRAVNVNPIDWKPKPRRAGWVGSLHHTPNIVALKALLARIAASESKVELDIVGRPEWIGNDLAARYPFVRYLGALDDSELPLIMQNWSLFLNPIFWLTKGASMKLADSLGRGLPVLSTRSGNRGYDLPEGVVFVTEDDPNEFVERMDWLLSNPEVLSTARAKIIESAPRMTSIETLGQRLREHLAPFISRS